jgi:hypothetical protein
VRLLHKASACLDALLGGLLFFSQRRQYGCATALLTGLWLRINQPTLCQERR